MKRKPVKPMVPSTRFPHGTRITTALNSMRGYEDGLPWEAGYVAPIGTSLGYEYHDGFWLAVQWDDEDDPNWHKVFCTAALFEKPKRRKAVK